MLALTVNKKGVGPIVSDVCIVNAPIPLVETKKGEWGEKLS